MFLPNNSYEIAGINFLKIYFSEDFDWYFASEYSICWSQAFPLNMFASYLKPCCLIWGDILIFQHFFRWNLITWKAKIHVVGVTTVNPFDITTQNKDWKKNDWRAEGELNPFHKD